MYGPDLNYDPGYVHDVSFVYALVDSAGIRYVGQTQRPEVRLQAHVGGTIDCSSSWMMDRQRARMIILDVVPREEARNAERVWMDALQEKCRLLNHMGNVDNSFRRSSTAAHRIAGVWSDRLGVASDLLDAPRSVIYAISKLRAMPLPAFAERILSTLTYARRDSLTHASIP